MYVSNVTKQQKLCRWWGLRTWGCRDRTGIAVKQQYDSMLPDQVWPSRGKNTILQTIKTSTFCEK